MPRHVYIQKYSKQSIAYETHLGYNCILEFQKHFKSHLVLVTELYIQSVIKKLCQYQRYS